LNTRARRVAAVLFPALVLITLLSLWSTLAIRPEVLTNYRRFPVLFVIPVAVAASLLAMLIYRRRGQDKGAFLSSCAYLVFMLVGAAAAVYPNLLTSTTDSKLNITVSNAASGAYSLSRGLIWWGFGMVLAIGYFVFVYRMFRGKVSEQAGSNGYL
jgi:cytochrome d ubiquinol oxidase subunit II